MNESQHATDMIPTNLAEPAGSGTDDEFDDVVGSFFGARRVAVIGASDGARDPWSFGARMTRSVLASDFDEVVLVSRSAEIDGHRTYPTIGDYDGSPGDVCVVVVAARQLESVIDDAIAQGWTSFLVVTGQLDSGQREYLRSLVPDRCRIWGPNCVGFVDVGASHSLMASSNDFALAESRPRIAIASQSGGAAGLFAHHVQELGCSVSHLISVGEEVDVGVDDVLDHVSVSGSTDGLLLFLESPRRPERFLAALRRCQRANVPVVIVAVGKTAKSRAVAENHSGALVGEWDELAAVARSCGAIVADSIREASGTLVAATMLRRSARLGRRVAVLTSSGGGGALACDFISDLDLDLAEFSSESRATLGQLSSTGTLATNPLDTAEGGGTPRTLPVYLDVVSTDPGLDAVIFVHGGALYAETIVAELVKGRPNQPPMIAVWPGLPEELRAACLDASIMVVTDLADACRWLSLAATNELPAPATSVAAVETTSDEQRDAGWLTYSEGLQLLDRYGIETAEHHVVGSSDPEPVLGDREPVRYVVKAGTLRTHKARLGGVRLDLGDQEAVRTAVAEMIEQFGEAVIEHQLDPGVDLMVSVRAGAVGGSLTVGLGGVFADAFGAQLTVALVQDRSAIAAALRSSNVGAVLGAADGPDGSALEALVDLAASLRSLVAAEAVEMIELNPVRMHEGTAVACDVKVKIRVRQEGEQ